MKEWIFKKFIDFDRKDDISEVGEWLAGLPHVARTRMNAIIAYMEITQVWTNTRYFKALKGYDGIYEIKFIVNNIQYRPLGCYGPDRKQFTILIGATKKGRRFNPINAPEIATERKKMVLENKSYTCEYYE
jgi:hypothetical protein